MGQWSFLRGREDGKVMTSIHEQSRPSHGGRIVADSGQTRDEAAPDCMHGHERLLDCAWMDDLIPAIQPDLPVKAATIGIDSGT